MVLFSCWSYFQSAKLDCSQFSREFLPNASGRLLTLLSAWWPAGQLVASGMAYGFLGTHFPINEGWRYLVYTMGGTTFVMFFARLMMNVEESPKYLLSQGRQADALNVIYKIAKANGATTWLSDDILNTIGGKQEGLERLEDGQLARVQILRNKIGAFSGNRIKSLFVEKQIWWTTIILWFSWSTIGLGYPLFNAFLPQFLARGSTPGASVPAGTTYRDYLIVSAVEVPGSFFAAFLVDTKLGRKFTMIIATLLSGVCLFLFTVSSNPNYRLAFSSAEAFFQNIMYGVLYTYTPEVFPAPVRGTAAGICSGLNRIFGLMAPIIGANVPSANPNVPVYVAGSLLLIAGLVMIGLPIETRGRQRL